MVIAALSFDQVIAIVGLVVSAMQALVLPVTIYLLVVQTRAMRVQTTALVEQSKEMTAQTRVFIDTIYSATYQSLYDAEAHIGELMMTYPEASRILMSPMPQPLQLPQSPQSPQSPVATNLSQQPGRPQGSPPNYPLTSVPTTQSAAMQGDASKGGSDTAESLRVLDPELRERVRWLGTAMLDFFEHIWTQAQKGGLPKDIWEAWEDYMGKMLSETRLRHIWQTERGYYSPGFRRFVDLKVGLSPETPAMPPLPRPPQTGVTGQLTPGDRRAGDTSTPQVARVLRKVTEEAAPSGVVQGEA